MVSVKTILQQKSSTSVHLHPGVESLLDGNNCPQQTAEHKALLEDSVLLLVSLFALDRNIKSVPLC